MVQSKIAGDAGVCMLRIQHPTTQHRKAKHLCGDALIVRLAIVFSPSGDWATWLDVRKTCFHYNKSCPMPLSSVPQGIGQLGIGWQK